MDLLIAVLLPCMCFFSMNRPWAGLLALALQISVVGWLPAAVWALLACSEQRSVERIRRTVMRVS